TGTTKLNLTGNALANTLTGNAADNIIRGGDGPDILRGGLGNDTLNGGPQTGGQFKGYDWADYSDAANAITVNLVLGTATGEGNDTLIDIEAVAGSAFDDSITGDDADNVLMGGLGNDTLNGGRQVLYDHANYSLANGAVQVNLGDGDGTATGADGNDILISIEGVRGSAFADTLTGDNRNNWMTGGGGDDLINGGGNFDWADYRDASGAVTVNLATGLASGADGNDVLAGIEALRGSTYDDTFTGDGGDNWLRGGGGNDVLNGGAGSDYADYKDAAGAIMVDLATGTARGADGNDTLANIENVRGSAYADTLTGGSGDNWLRGGGGNDVLNGGAGSDYADYKDAAGAVTVNLATGTASGADGNDRLASIEHVRGSAYADTLTGNSGTNFLRGGAGNDRLDGGAGSDWAAYWDATGGVTVDLAAHTSSGADGNDTLIGIENVTGSAYADTLKGDAGSNWLRGNGGNDTINGDTGYDWADYWNASGSVTVNLAAGTASGADGNDTLSSIEAVAGSYYYSDALTGDDGDNWLDGRGGNDTLDGGAGADWANYYYAASAVTVDLSAGNASGADGNDVLISIESISGSNYADTLTGDGGNNTLRGNAGDDTLNGGDGSDVLDGGAGNDVLDGGYGADALAGGTGNDTYRTGIADAISEASGLVLGSGTDILEIRAATAGLSEALSAAFDSFSQDMKFSRVNGGKDLRIDLAMNGGASAGAITVAGMNSVQTMVETLRLYDVNGQQVAGDIDLTSVWAASGTTAKALALTGGSGTYGALAHG
ncbi:MAG: calcium binding hemolysin protein, partial [Rhodocyclaceae bacterium]